MVLLGFFNHISIENIEEFMERQIDEYGNIIEEYKYDDEINDIIISNIYHIDSYEIHDCDLEEEFHVKERGYKKLILYVEPENDCDICSRTNNIDDYKVKIVDMNNSIFQVYNAYISEETIYDAYKEYIEYFEEMI